MKTSLAFDFAVDKASNTIRVEREFDAPLNLVWAAWTQAELLDQWWAPEPYKTHTKELDFREGGRWLYAMVGPEGEEQWCRADYKTISNSKFLSWKDGFCDEQGNFDTSMPHMMWNNTFSSTGDSTVVSIKLEFEQLEDLEKIMEMGFREGFTAGLENLDRYLSTQFQLRQQYKTGTKARVSTCLNFPGTTEEAFNFYRQVFKGEFSGKGLTRFGDIDMPAGLPPLSEADKKLIIHAELEILAGHVLMATDAPESMGMKVELGNNMHINLEPETREETERLFKELSDGGEVSMPLQDMFWGAYFASFKDKYGINWMLNHQQPN